MCAYRHSTPEESQPDPQLKELFGDVVHAYTRAQAIEDGALIDLTDPPFDTFLRMKGLRLHTAITDRCFAACIGQPEQFGDDESLKRYLHLLTALLAAIRAAGSDEDRVWFKVLGADGKPVDCWSLCGPGDRGEPVCTIMLTDED